MQVPLEITYRNVEKTEDIDRLIREKMAKIEKICNYIVSCHVVIEHPQEYQNAGNPYQIRIEMSIPKNHYIVVKHGMGKEDMHLPLSTVIRKAFDAVRKQVRELVQRQHAHLKVHDVNGTIGIVNKINREEGYGFLLNAEGEDVYFHKNSVVQNEFDQLYEGATVIHTEEPTERGPKATSVKLFEPIDKREKSKVG